MPSSLFIDELLHPPPSRSTVWRYIIACAPRTGSTLLAVALTRTKLAGRPGEYFEEKVRLRVAREIGATTDAEYLPKLIQYTATANGAFGTKLFWFHLKQFIHDSMAAGGLPANIPISKILPDLLQYVLGSPPSYIWLRRRNPIAQAISLYRAQQTNVWEITDNSQNTAATVDFDFHSIDAHVRNLTRNDANWGCYFREYGIEPLIVFYEDLAQNYTQTVVEVLSYLHLTVEGPIPAPSMSRQADALSLIWESRYRQLATSGPARQDLLSDTSSRAMRTELFGSGQQASVSGISRRDRQSDRKE